MHNLLFKSFMKEECRKGLQGVRILKHKKRKCERLYAWDDVVSLSTDLLVQDIAMIQYQYYIHILLPLSSLILTEQS